MKKTNGISISKNISKKPNDKNPDIPSQQEFSDDWKKQMALKNEAILKSIEELLDKSLGNQD